MSAEQGRNKRYWLGSPLEAQKQLECLARAAKALEKAWRGPVPKTCMQYCAAIDAGRQAIDELDEQVPVLGGTCKYTQPCLIVSSVYL